MIARIVLLALTLVAVVTFADWLSSPLRPCEAPIQEHSESGKSNEAPKDYCSAGKIVALWRAVGHAVDTWHDDLNAIATIVIAAFTTVLGVFTVRLARSTRIAADAAKRAADAADASAKAVTVIERAYVYPIIVGHGAFNELISNARVFYVDDITKNDVPAPETTEITFKFKNFGKTPAILKTAFVGVGVAPLGVKIGLAIPEAVLGVLEETNPLRSEMQVGITRNQALHIGAYTGHICFEGEITFNDIWENEHTTEFYFVWDMWVARMNLRWVETKTKQKGEQRPAPPELPD